jgi:hypothetical protein
MLQSTTSNFGCGAFRLLVQILTTLSSGHERFYHIAIDVRQAEVTSLVAVSQHAVIDAKLI